MALTEAQQAEYQEQGFLRLPRLFAPERLRAFDERFVALVHETVPRPPNMVVMQDVMVAKGVVEPETPLHGVNKILSFDDDEVLFAYATEPALLSAVRSLVGPALMTISTNVFNKPPGVDGRHPLHQDLRYFTLRPADQIVAAWTAIDAATRENGCLAVVPGSHREGLLRHGDPDWEHVNFGFFAVEDAPTDARVHVEMEPGDTLLFHPLLLHGSGHNGSRGFRRAISAHFASVDCTRASGPRKREPVTRVLPGPESEHAPAEAPPWAH